MSAKSKGKEKKKKEKGFPTTGLEGGERE